MNKFNQKTISEEIKLKGIGLHNGQKVNLTIIPAEANTGIIFKRTDIKTENTIQSKQAELERFQIEKVGPQGEIYQIHDRLMQPIYTKVDNVIQKVGKEKGYDYIFNVVSGGIVYALPQNDLTQDIIDALQKLDDIENE